MLLVNIQCQLHGHLIETKHNFFRYEDCMKKF